MAAKVTPKIETEYCQTCPEPQKPPSPNLILARRVSAAALAVFAAYTNIWLFLPFFAAGVAFGLHQYSTFGEVPQLTGCSMGCGQVFNYLTGIKPDPYVSLAFDVWIFADHMDHTPFVPLAAFGTGVWLVDLWDKYAPSGPNPLLSKA
jgi:hypothetical protein